MKILFTDPTEPILTEQLVQAGFSCDHDLESPREIILDKLPGYDGIVIRSRLKIDRELMDAAPRLRFIARSGVGVEHIDLDYAAAKGITVFTSPEGSRDTVGEHTLGLLLMLMNNLARADRQVRHGQWIRGGNRGYEIKGKTIGILGYGNMGTAFAQRLQGFDCEVIAHDKFKKNYGDEHATAVSLQELQTRADVLSIHIPYTPENHHFVNGAFLDAFAKPLWLVNTARGLVLHTADLVERLQSGQVRGAALDVIEYEDQSFVHLDPQAQPAPFQKLLGMPNVVLNPHIAGWSYEAEEGHARTLARKILAQFG
ncbi:MAG: hydroxyacid dehydrogenase [Lewinella sp.]|nr:hydroxyacid dehydrogenase [Lewinella sp.]